MLSAILGDKLAESFGVARLEDQTERGLAWAPLPQPDGKLIQDPGFTLPTTAGPLPWRLFYYSELPNKLGEWGYGRRASWPTRLCAQMFTVTADTCITTYAYVEHEDGLGATYVNPGGGATYFAASPRNFDTLVQNSDGSWDETRLESGARFHYPAGNYVSLAYFETPFGRRVSFNYDVNQLLQSIVEPQGRRITYQYQTNPSLVYQVQDWAQRLTTLNYDPVTNDMVSVQDPAGYITSYQADGSHRLIGIQDPENHSVTFAWDPYNRVTQRSIDGALGQYSYSAAGTVYTDPNGHVWTTLLDQWGDVAQVTDPVGASRYAEYDDNGQPVFVQDGNGYAGNYGVVMQYDGNGRETYRAVPIADGQTAAEQRTYDQYGNLLTDQDPLNRVTSYIWADAGVGLMAAMRRPRAEINPLGQRLTYGYTPWGALQTVMTPLGYVTTYGWLESGVMATEQNPLGYVRSYQYSAAGDRILAQDEAGYVTSMTYDPVSRLVSVQNPAGATRTTVWTGVGTVSQEIDPLGFITTHFWNARAEETCRWDARGYRWTNVYDLKGRETQRIDPNGNITSTLWDPADNPVGSVDGMGRVTTAVLDYSRNRVATIPPSGLRYSALFDQANRQYASISPGGLTTTSVLDLAGQQVASIDTTGIAHTTLYDLAGRVQVQIQPTGARSTNTFDADGRHISTLDAYNGLLSHGYDPRNLRVSTTDQVNLTVTSVFDARGLQTARLLPGGAWTSYVYDGARNRIAEIDFLSWPATTVYDLNDRPIAHVDELGNIATTFWDPVSQIVATQDILGNFATTLYDPARRAVQHIDPLGGVQTTLYDASNAVVANVDQLGFPRTSVYDVFGRSSATVDQSGARWSVIYDPVFGWISAHQNPLAYLSSVLYDVYGRAAGAQNPKGETVTTNFDSFGRAVGTSNPLGFTVTTTLDLLDRPVAQSDARGYLSTTVFDLASRAVAQVDAQGNRVTTVYESRGNPGQFIDSLGRVTTHAFDLFSRPVGVQDARGFWVTTTLDQYGRTGSEINARGYAFTTLYDGFGRVSGRQDPLDHIQTNIYDSVGRLAAHQNELGFLSTTLFDALWRPQAYQDSLGRFSTTVFDPVGRAQASVSADGARSSTVYDVAGQPVAQINPLGFRYSSLFDPAGRAYQQIDPLGFVSSTLFDPAGRPTLQFDQQGFMTQTAFDPDGRPVSTTGPDLNTWASIYDPIGRLWQQVDPAGVTTTSLFSQVGDRVAAIDGEGYRVSYHFDEVHQNVSVEDQQGHRVSTLFDGAGLPYRTQDARGFLSTTLFDEASRAYGFIDARGNQSTTLFDAASQVTGEIRADGSRLTYNFDAVGNLVQSVNGLGFVTSYGFDVVNRRNLSVDPIGRSRTTMYDLAGQPTQQISPKGQVTASTFDPRGDEIQRVYGDGSNVQYAYGPRREMTQVIDPTGVWTLGYDPMGRQRQEVMPLPSGVVIQIPDAASPDGGLIQAADAFLYGTSSQGGVSAKGTIFRSDTSGNIRLVRSFGGWDGSSPLGRVTQGHDGLLYGMTQAGGQYGYGVVFRVRVDGTDFSLLHHFGDPAVPNDARSPDLESSLIEDPNNFGTFIGAGYAGGTSGLGAVFSMTVSSIGKVTGYSILHNFVTADGTHPAGALAAGPAGVFYGCCGQGGANGNGTIYKLTAGVFTPVHTFNDAVSSDGIQPGGLVSDGSGTTFYGTARSGGTYSNGTLFSIVSDVFSLLHAFNDGATPKEGSSPRSQPIVASDGNLYGVCGQGGDNSLGTLWKANTSGSILAVYEFASAIGGQPQSPPVQATDGNFYGVCLANGANGQGSLYKRTSGGTVTSLHSFGTQILLGTIHNPLQSATIYDALGNRQRTDFWWGSQRYLYDARNQVVGLIDPGYGPAAVPGGTATWIYDSRGLPIQQVNPRGTASTMAYAEDGQLLQVRHSTSGGAEIARAIYSYDPVGNPSVKSTAAGPITYAYDQLNRLGSENNPANGPVTWGYDAADRRISQQNPVALTTFGYDPADQRLVATTAGQNTTYAFDLNGNLISIVPPAFPPIGGTGYNGRSYFAPAYYSPDYFGRGYFGPTSGPVTFTWDAADRLVGSAQFASLPITMAYRYDDLLHAKQGPTGPEGYLRDRSEVLFWTRTEGGAMGAAQMYGAGGDLSRAVGQQSGGAGQDSQYHLDAQGTVQAVSDGSQATKTTYQTDAWGNVISGGTADNPYDYAGNHGYWRDQDTGLVYVKARWYDPIAGHWLSVDPVDGEPRYGYAYQAPTSFVDPSGKQADKDALYRILRLFPGIRAHEIQVFNIQFLSGGGDRLYLLEQYPPPGWHPSIPGQVALRLGGAREADRTTDPQLRQMGPVAQAAILLAAHEIAMLQGIREQIDSSPIYQAGVYGGVVAPPGWETTATVMAAGMLNRASIQEAMRQGAQQGGWKGALKEVAAGFALPESQAVGGAVGALPKAGRMAAALYFGAQQAPAINRRINENDYSGAVVLGIPVALPFAFEAVETAAPVARRAAGGVARRMSGSPNPIMPGGEYRALQAEFARAALSAKFFYRYTVVGEHATTFFGEHVFQIMLSAIEHGRRPTVGRKGGSAWMMPAADASEITDYLSAARATGMAPTIHDAAISWDPQVSTLYPAVLPEQKIYGLEVFTRGLAARASRPGDAVVRGKVQPDYLGTSPHTAVATKAAPGTRALLINPTREFVVVGGMPVPAGNGYLFELRRDGTRRVIVRF